MIMGEGKHQVPGAPLLQDNSKNQENNCLNLRGVGSKRIVLLLVPRFLPSRKNSLLPIPAARLPRYELSQVA